MTRNLEAYEAAPNVQVRSFCAALLREMGPRSSHVLVEQIPFYDKICFQQNMISAKRHWSVCPHPCFVVNFSAKNDQKSCEARDCIQFYLL